MFCQNALLIWQLLGLCLKFPRDCILDVFAKRSAEFCVSAYCASKWFHFLRLGKESRREACGTFHTIEFCSAMSYFLEPVLLLN